MADWRQIRARIGKAKAAPDPSVRLAQLFEKTRDGMVAFELARLEEKAGQTGEAVRWYTTAVERFRRAEWRKKAEEALARLGAMLPAPLSQQAGHDPISPGQGGAFEAGAEIAPSQPFLWEAREIPQAVPEETPPEPVPAEAEPETSTPVAAGAAVGAAGGKRRRRGRRGGRGRGRGRKDQPAVPAGREHSSPGILAEARARVAAKPAASTPPSAPVEPVPEPLPERQPEVERPSPAVRWPGYGRAGEPALASRLAHLESNLRRLLAGAPSSLEDAEEAPAGPGVYLLSDSDLTACYYIESCRTLRIALGQLARGRGQRGEGRGNSLRARMADHLGISEARVAKYLKEHCVVRWLQLDEGAFHLARFAVAILRPALNTEEDW